MCYLTECPNCKKTTWGGCGAHLNGLFDGIKQENLCKCDNGKPKQQQKGGNKWILIGLVIVVLAYNYFKQQ
ncbi:Conserved_hypothetical protein [Hexamita inflata]|uniref:Uncharacterized protein n=1 Tax=Hexamita inflata TaxID=28002 RepID=A0AA86QJM5_9EUKA|nr:Conserved hypothetical protein [Hexamita inflata]CAI9955698.1 Conserved hypothetical protein [Hexamita inflata]